MDRDPTNWECTRDPIFLLQTREFHIIDLPDWLGYDGDGFWFEDECDEDISSWYSGEPDDPAIDETKLLTWLSERESSALGTGVPCALEYWNIEGVFLTRQEAESYAKRTEYNYRHGWRVYCRPCDGELARILNELPDTTTHPASR